MSKKPAPREDSHPAAIMARLLQRWVEEESSSPAPLQMWLCGYNLPPIGSAADDEPFIWLLRGCAAYAKGRKALAAATQTIISNRLSPPVAEQKNRYWFNLIHLADGLRMPGQLRPVLREFAHKTPVEGEYRGISLRKSLLRLAGLPAEAAAEWTPSHPFPPTDPAAGDPCFQYFSSLDKRQFGAAALARWLSGDLPFDDTAPYAGEAPYVRLVGCIPLGSRHYSRKLALAKAAAELLEQIRNVKLALTQKRVLHHLLLLCGELRVADVLCSRLKSWLDRAGLPKNLRKDLRTAILNNQLNNELKEGWLGMLRGEDFKNLPADTAAALEAIRLMPLSEKKPGQWDSETIGRALGLVARDMAANAFADLLDEIDGTYPNLDYGKSIGPCAGRDWPAWAIGSLGLHLVDSPKGGNSATPLESFDRWLTKVVAPELEKKGLKRTSDSDMDYTPTVYAELKKYLPKRSTPARVNLFSQCLIMDEESCRDLRQAQNALDVRTQILRDLFGLKKICSKRLKGKRGNSGRKAEDLRGATS